MINKSKEEIVKTFGNNLACQLTPSNESMRAVRWAREELTEILNTHSQNREVEIRKEVEGISEFNAKLAISPSPDFLKGAVAMKKMILDNLK